MEGRIEKVRLDKNIQPGVDQCLVEFDSLDSYVVFMDYNDLVSYVGSMVEFTTRTDVVNGLPTSVINWIAQKNVVQSVKSENSFNSQTLIPAGSKSSYVITFDQSTMKMQDLQKSTVVFVHNYTKGKSAITHWWDLECLDKNSTAFNLRIFSNDDPETVDATCEAAKGRYVMVDIKRTPYGFQLGGELKVIEQQVITSPEVALAESYLKEIVTQDPMLESYVNKYNMLDQLRDIVYFEPGYHLVEMASECILLDAISKISGDYDIKLLRRAFFVSRGYLMNGGNKLSAAVLNYHRLQASELKIDLQLLHIIDVCGGVDEIGDLNKAMFYNIKAMCHNIIMTRRGHNEEIDVNAVINTLNNKYGRLL